MSQTVQNTFEDEKIDLDFLEEFANNEDSEYWESSRKFIKQNWSRPADGLSEKQSAWMNRILEDCVEARISGFKPGGI